VGSCEHGNEPSGSTKDSEFLTCLVTVSFSRSTLFHGDSSLDLMMIRF